MKQPFIIVIAGPNGIGKSTFAKWYLQTIPNCDGIIDADEIARTVVAATETERAARAGRLALARMHDSISARRSFAIETTMSGRSLAQTLRRARQEGYYIANLLLWAPSVQTSADRVARRVREGGHDISIDIQLRRYDRIYSNFFSIYMEVCDEWRYYEADCQPPTLLAIGYRRETEG